MALSSELLLRLESSEPLSKRLKLAENAYCCTDLSITHKRDLIIFWLCKVAPTDTVAWNSLKLCIDCQELNDRTPLKSETKKKLIDTLVEKLKLTEEIIPDYVLECCSCILSNMDMHHYFQTVLRNYARFLKTLLTRLKLESLKVAPTVDDNSEKNIVTLSKAGHACVINVIESLLQMHKQHSDKDDLATAFLDHVLSPLCALIDPTCTDNSNRIGAEAHKCIQHLLFGKARQAEYKACNDTTTEGIPAKLFWTLSHLTNKMNADAIAAMLSYVFRAAVGSYKTDSTLIDKLFRNHVNSANSFKIVASNSLMKYLNDIPLDFNNKINDLTLTEYFNSLIDDILQHGHLIDEDYNLLRNIACLNPLIIENKLQPIFKRILLETKLTKSQEQSYAQLMIDVLDASSRLRREQKLIPWLLQALQATLKDNKNCHLSTAQIFPADFASKFTTLVSGLHSTQIIAMLKSLTFHLKSNCVAEYNTNSTNDIVLMSECTVKLLIMFFDGIRIYEHVVPTAVQQKFSSALGELGIVLSALVEKVLNLKHNGRIMVVLLEAALSWTQVRTVLSYYAWKSEADKLPFPISDDCLQQLIQRVENFGDAKCRNALNSFLLYRIKVSIVKDSQAKLVGLIGGLENFWSTILTDYPELISLLSHAQLLELASLMLGDLLESDDGGFEKKCEILEREILQENERFLIAILCTLLMRIGSQLEGSMCASITTRINPIKVLEAGTDNVTAPALDHKRHISNIPQWPNVINNNLNSVEKHLQTLLCLPLRHFSTPLRTMTVVIVYVISKECETNNEIKNLCYSILLETLEEGGPDIAKYIDLKSLIPCVPGNKVLEKVFESSVCNMDKAVSLTELDSLNDCPDEAVPAVLSCIVNLKPKLNNDQKQVIKAVEDKLCKKLIKKHKSNPSEPNMKMVTISLKTAIEKNKITKELKTLIRSTLKSALIANNESDNSTEDRENFDTQGDVEFLEFASLVLINRTRLDLPEELVMDIWMTTLQHPQPKLLTPLLAATSPKVFNDVLVWLLALFEIRLKSSNGAMLSNAIIVWKCIMKSDMSVVRSKCRLNAAQKLLTALQMADIAANDWPDLIKLLHFIVESKHMQLPGEFIDMIMMVAARALREVNLMVCNDVLMLCLELLRTRIGMITDRLPSLLQLYKQSIIIVRGEAKKDNAFNTQLGLCVYSIETCTNALVKLSRDFVRLSTYQIAELLEALGDGDMPQFIKEPFARCINIYLSICDANGITFLMRTLPTGTREIFKDFNEKYSKFHKFTGKI